MMMINTYDKSLAEVYKVIDNLEYKEYNKIPKKFLNLLYKNMDKDYYLKTVIDEEFIDNKMSESAKEILALVYRDYLVTSEEREQLLKEESEEEKRIQQELREKYNPDNIFKKNKKENNNYDVDTSLIKIEELKWYKKFINKILSLLKK